METKNTDLSALRIDSGHRSYNPSKRKTAYYVAGTAAALLLLSFFLKDALFNPAIQVKLTSATIQSSSQTNAVLTASGYVVAQRKAAVASKGTGRLVYLGFVEGDKVKKDQIIARLEDSDIKAQLAQARANLKVYEADLKEAESSYRRNQSLLKANASTQLELEAAEARYLRVLASIELAKAQVTSAEVALENTLIRSPFDGTILTKNADVGEIVAPLGAGMNSKSAVVTLADMTSLQVDTDVSESNIQRIGAGQNCEITLDAYPGQSYAGYIAKIVPTADRAKATVLVKVGFNKYDDKVLPEMSAKVTFLSRDAAKNTEKPALVIPASAAVKRNGRDVVFIFSDGKAASKDISIGRKFSGYVEITSGLNDGDKVIDNPAENITDGAKVEAASN